MTRTALTDLSLADKVRLLTGSSFFSFTGVPEAGVSALTMSDGPLGVKAQSQSGGDPSVVLPCATNLAATWDTALLERVGALLGEECRRTGTNLLLGPTMNLHRSPLGGRVFECYSEDPLLTGLLAAAYVRGVQDEGVGACLKHLVCNDAETERHTVDVLVDEATLREVYLLPFEIAMADADPALVMAAYNRVNGTPMTEHGHILQEVLKDEWGFRGLVVSDFFATHTTAESLLGGLDVVLPGPFGPWGERLVEAVRDGVVPGARVDEAVARLLHVIDRFGTDSASAPVRQPSDPQRRRRLVEIAAAGMTVLKNAGVLPLADLDIALVGTAARETLLMGGGSSELTPPHRVSILDGLEAARLGRVTYVAGVEIAAVPPTAEPSFLVNPTTGLAGMRLDVIGPDGSVSLTRHVVDSRTVLGWNGELSNPGSTARLTARINHAGPVQVGVLGLGNWRLAAGTEVADLVVPAATGQPGESLLAPPRAVAPTLYQGPFTFEATFDPGRLTEGSIGLIARPMPLADNEAIAAAVQVAGTADVAVVVVGVTAAEETESKDRVTLTLPGQQDALVEAVAAVARATVVVVNAASPVLMPWADRVDAILVAGLPGQEGGTAVAACLTGDLEPAGRLASSWPAIDGTAPGWDVQPSDGVLSYDEGPLVGYRGYAQDAPPAFWFGAGEGYGSWRYLDGRVSVSAEAPSVRVSLTNLGPRTSREVAQVYLAPLDTSRPTRLVGWASAVVEPGATRPVDVTCDHRAMRRWLTAENRWDDALEPGHLLVARGLGDVRLTLELPTS